MKNLKSFFAVALVAFAMVSCTKLEKVLPKADGVWNVTSEVYIDYEDGTEVARETTATSELGTYTFEKDETGVYSATGVADEAFTWSANSDNDKLTITQTSFPIGITFDVLDLTSKSQTWMLSLEDGIYLSETIVTLERE